jgi:hypothetical protein
MLPGMTPGSAPLSGARLVSGARLAAVARIPGSGFARSAGRMMRVALALLALHGNAVAGEVAPVHLALPLLTTLAFGRSFLEARLDSGPRASPLGFRDNARAALGLLPEALRVPDLYAVDVTEREPRRFAEPLDRMTYASFNLLPRRFSRGTLSLMYATESLPALGDTRRLVGLAFEVDF